MTQTASDAIRPRRRWFQFSLRGLLVIVTGSALLSYWMARPTILAHQFKRAIAAQDYALAESLFVKDGQRLGVFPSSFATDIQTQRSVLVLQPITFRQVIDRERRIGVYVPRGDEMMEFDWSIAIVARPQGLEVQLAIH